MEQQPKEIKMIEVQNTVKYLGVTLNNKRNCYSNHIRDSMVKGNKYVSILPATIATSTNRLLIGKTYWKSIALPSILFSSKVINYNKTQLDELQRIENKAWRYILHAPKYAPVAAFRSEVGAES